VNFLKYLSLTDVNEKRETEQRADGQTQSHEASTYCCWKQVFVVVVVVVALKWLQLREREGGMRPVKLRHWPPPPPLRFAVVVVAVAIAIVC